MKSLLKSLLYLTVVTIPFTGISAQELTPETEEKVRAEIEALHRQEQEAFIEGDCEKVLSFFAQNATFFTRGRQVSPEERLNFCNQIPRPFTRPGDRKPDINDRFFILSDTSAYFVRTIDFEPEGEDASVFKREVVTKVWSKTHEGWKIVHFHSSVDTVSDM